MTNLLTVNETASKLSISPITIRKLIFRKQIPVVRIGRSVRIREEDAESIIREGYLPEEAKK